MCTERRIVSLISWPIMVILWLLEATRFFYPMPLLAVGSYLIISEAETTQAVKAS
ncbi:hypothetical protein LINGRAHAP2_LOCUS7883 [Linum grandiflorum]